MTHPPNFEWPSDQKNECPSRHAQQSYLTFIKGDIAKRLEPFWHCPECNEKFNANLTRLLPTKYSNQGQNCGAKPEKETQQGSPLCQKCYDELMSPIIAEQPPQEMIGGMAHSVGTPPYHLIPAVAWRELANQYALGEKLKGKDAWNALSDNQHVLKSQDALAVRLGHVIAHCLALQESLAADEPLNIRDAAAIMWGGSFAICAIDAQGKANALQRPTV